MSEKRNDDPNRHASDYNHLYGDPPRFAPTLRYSKAGQAGCIAHPSNLGPGGFCLCGLPWIDHQCHVV
jgi:hypothetical protein